MAHSGKSITFATDLYPHESDIYTLGKDANKWKIVGSYVKGYNFTLYDSIATPTTDKVTLQWNSTDQSLDFIFT